MIALKNAFFYRAFIQTRYEASACIPLESAGGRELSSGARGGPPAFFRENKKGTDVLLKNMKAEVN